jgi:hypothetical protein
MSDKASKQAYDPATYRSNTRLGITTDVFSSDIPHRAPVLCYIAGIECPITEAQVSYGVWKIPEASITMFPDPQLQRFGAEDRVPVALFYLDEYIDANNPTWRLLFEGEIVGWSYMNAAGARSIQFSCVMNMAMWTQLFIFYMTSLSSFAEGVAAKKGDPSVTTQTQAVPGFSLFRQGLLVPPKKSKDEKPSADDYIKRPYDLAYNVVRSLISNKVPEKQRCVPGINFFARWTRREQFHNRWVAIPFLEEPTTEIQGKEVVETGVPGIFPVLRASQSLQAVRAVEKQVADRYSGGSIYTILKQVLDSVLMELCMLPTAPCVSTRVGGSSDGVIRGEPVFKTGGQKIATKTQDSLTAARAALVTARTSPVITPALTSALSVAGVGYTLGDNVTSQLIEAAIQNIDKKLSVTRDTGPKDALLPTRLGNYFIKPQMLFGLPPNCNVIFPSMTPQISYQENYVTQPTRFYLQDDSTLHYAGFADPNNKELKATLLNALSRAYPPSVDAKWTAHMQKGQAAKSGRNLLVWPEEFFKGPVTARQPAPPWLMFVAAQTQSAGIKPGSKVGTPNSKSTKADATSANDRDKGALTDQDIYALYAQYEYFRNRFVARGGAVTCAFHPYLVPGFPLAVFDDFQSRMHTVGYLMNVTQQFSARSVGTSLNYGYGRTLHEFFDLLANEIDTGGAVAERKNLAMAAAPAEPIKEVRDVIQHFSKAEQFYQTLLHRRQSVPAVFEYRRLIAMVKGDGTLEDIQIEGVNEETIAAKKAELEGAKRVLKWLKDNPTAPRQRFAEGKLNAPQTQAIKDAIDLVNAPVGGGYELIVTSTRLDQVIAHLYTLLAKLDSPNVKHNLDNVLEREFMPKPGAEPYFDSYDAAMRYCARPICTLDEYIEFIRGVKEGPQDDMAYVDGSRVPSARYYARIRKMVGAPKGFTPTKAQQGLEPTPKAINPQEEAAFPELRAQWEKSLLAYRRNVYSTTEVQR